MKRSMSSAKRRFGAVLVSLLVACGLTSSLGAASAGAVTTLPTLVAVRAAHQVGYDRVVFEFQGPLPTATAAWTTQIVADGSGLPVPVAGRALVSVVFRGAQAHTATGTPTVPARVAYNLPGVLTTVRAGDFEGVLSYGIGVAKASSLKVTRLSSPSRLVVDITTPYATVARTVYFADSAKIRANVSPPVTGVVRQVLASAPATGVLDRLYAGPTPAEKTAGLSLAASLSTGFSGLSISTDAVARLRLVGGCGGGSAVVTIADQMKPTLKQFSTIRWVKVYDPLGTTLYPTGLRDSTPACLEP